MNYQVSFKVIICLAIIFCSSLEAHSIPTKSENSIKNSLIKTNFGLKSLKSSIFNMEGCETGSIIEIGKVGFDYFVSVKIGEQSFNLLLDLNSKFSWVYSKSNKHPGGYNSSTGSLINPNKMKKNYDGFHYYGDQYWDSFSLLSGDCKYNSVIMAITSTENYKFNDKFDGVLSLREVLDNYELFGHYPYEKFSLFFSHNGGSLTFGQYNPSLVLDINNIDYLELVGEEQSYGWGVILDSFYLNDLNLSNGGYLYFDSTKSSMAVPKTLLKRIMKSLGAVLNKSDNTYYIDCNAEFKPDLSFELKGKNFLVPYMSYIRSYTDLNGNTKCFVNIEKSDNPHVWTVGTDFMTIYYILFDSFRSTIGITKASN